MANRSLLPWWEVSRWRLLFSKVGIIEILREHCLSLFRDEVARRLGLIGTHADDDFAYAGEDILGHFRIGDHGIDACGFEQTLNNHRLCFIFGLEDNYQVTAG